MTPTVYKLYTAILTKRIREEIENKEIMPQNQAGFKKGMEAINNIYILNYVVNRQLSKNEEKLVALFIDLKAAFDKVKMMRKRRIREGLVERVAKVLEETRSKIRVRKEVEEFLDGKGGKAGVSAKPVII